MMNNDKPLDDEIDLREIFSIIWAGKFIIILVVIIFVALASSYLHNSVRSYETSITLKSLTDSGDGPDLGNFGGLANLAGIALPTGTTSDFETFKFLLKSEEVAKRVFDHNKLVKQIFFSEWDEQEKDFQEKSPNLRKKVINTIKPILTGDNVRAYMKPNPERLADYVTVKLKLNENNETGFLTLSMENHNPLISAELMLRLIEHTDKLMKEKFVLSGTSALQFYQIKISKARSQEHREILATLIAKEEKKLLLATRDGPFVSEILVGPKTPRRPSSPNNIFILFLGAVTGFIIGIIISFLRRL